jgi:hypothetical protein
MALNSSGSPRQPSGRSPEDEAMQQGFPTGHPVNTHIHGEAGFRVASEEATLPH